MYFSLISRDEYSKGDFFSGQASMPEKYFTKIANTLYKDSVIYQGTDYVKFPSATEFPEWPYPGDTTTYTGGPHD
jgi:hypothetical protein